MSIKIFCKKQVVLLWAVMIVVLSFATVEATAVKNSEEDYLREVLLEHQKINSFCFNILGEVNTPLGDFKCDFIVREILKPMWAKGEGTVFLKTFSNLTKEFKCPFYLQEKGNEVIFYYQDAKDEWKKNTRSMDFIKIQNELWSADYFDCLKSIQVIAEDDKTKTIRVTINGEKMSERLEENIKKFLPQTKMNEKSAQIQAFFGELQTIFLDNLEQTYVIDKKSKHILKIYSDMTKSLQNISYKILDTFGKKIAPKDQKFIRTIIDLSNAQVNMYFSEYDNIKSEVIPKEVLKAKSDEESFFKYKKVTKN